MRISKELADALMRKHGISVEVWTVLKLLARRPDLPAWEIVSRRSGGRKGVYTSALHAMQRDGFIRRIISVSGGTFVYRLSDTGERLIEELRLAPWE